MSMDRRLLLLPIIFITAIVAVPARGQVDDICSEAGVIPSLDSPFAHVPYVYGRITLRGRDNAKLPRVVVIYSDGKQPVERYTVGRTGNYCFKRAGQGGTLVVEVDGLEAARRTLPGLGASQQREDFDVTPGVPDGQKAPAVISTRFARPPNDKTIELYKKAADAERSKELDKAVEFVSQIVVVDPQDYIAWAKLGSLQFERQSFPEADAAYRRSLELRVDFTPAWIDVGQLRLAQKQFPAAIEIFKHAIELEPTAARTYRLLGEAYLQAKQGTFGVAALDRALKLDPIGMAECHLVKAHLYELAGAKQLAVDEYKAFLKKVPDHPDRKKMEAYIKNNS